MTTILDPILPVRGKLIAALLADVPLKAIVDIRIYPGKTPSPIVWPFVRLDGAVSTPVLVDGGAGGGVNGLIHCFVKLDKVLFPDPEATCATINSHVVRIVSAIDGIVLGADHKLDVYIRQSQVIQDTAEADAYHGIVRYEALAL